MKFRIIDSTGDTLQHPETFEAASQSFSDLMKTYMAYDAKTQTVINDLTPENEEVIFHRKIVAG